MASRKVHAHNDGYSGTIAERMLQLRLAYGLSRRQVEKLSGGRISAHSLFSYETGRRRPKIATLMTLADFYGVGMGYFLNDGTGGLAFMPASAGRVVASLASRPEFIDLLTRLSQLPPPVQERVLESWSATMDLVAPDGREDGAFWRTAVENSGEGITWQKSS